MQFFATLLTLSAVASAATASSIVARQGPPNCAVPCLQSTNTFGCSSTDNACLCRNAQFVAAQEACVNAACTNPSDLAQANTFAHQLCLFEGVTLTSVEPASTSSAASVSSAASAASATATGSSASSAASSTAPAATGNSAAIITSSGSFAMLAGVAAVAFAL